MKTKIDLQPNYGNWVSDKRIIQTFITFLVFGALATALLAEAARWGVLAMIASGFFTAFATLFLVATIYFLRAKELFSYTGGGVQLKILELVLSHIRWDGKGRALDIGCGSGALAILLAKQYGEARIDGIDYWGGSWGYFQKQCEQNAALEGVPGRIAFQHASASALPFPDETFDLAVSNLVFHEVKDSADKRDVIKEALRVVKKGGCFVLQDLLLMEPIFGKPDELVALIKSWGVQEVHFEETRKAEFIPGALRLPFMVGTLGMVYGVK